MQSCFSCPIWISFYSDDIDGTGGNGTGSNGAGDTILIELIGRAHTRQGLIFFINAFVFLYGKSGTVSLNNLR